MRFIRRLFVGEPGPQTPDRTVRARQEPLAAGSVEPLPAALEVEPDLPRDVEEAQIPRRRIETPVDTLKHGGQRESARPAAAAPPQVALAAVPLARRHVRRRLPGQCAP